MNKRQPVDCEDMLDGNGQELKAVGLLPHNEIGYRQAMTQLTELRLMMTSQTLTTLSNTVFAESRRAVSAAVDSCAGLLSHQINV